MSRDQASEMTPMCAAETDGRMCCLPAAHDHNHAHVITWPQGDPDPAPEWRRLVDEVDIGRYRDDPLGWVTYFIHLRAASPDSITAKRDLARIVAICEQQIGSGKIDPDLSDTYGCTAWGLIHALTIDDEPTPACWWSLGDAAAHWLATLTGEAS